MTLERHTVARVPFPFTDRRGAKHPPALVLSQPGWLPNAAGMAMIASKRHAPWPLDWPVQDLQAAGLPVPSVVRFKLITLDHSLAAEDAPQVEPGLRRLLGL
ncbi:MAG: hypothetical protein ABWJ90_04650 [Thermus sp.]